MNGITLEQAREEAFRRQLARIRLAREDVNAYIEYTELVPPRHADDTTGTRWAKQDPVHREWQAHWDKAAGAFALELKLI